MDSEDRDHFKTLQNPSPKRLDVWRQQQKRASLQSDPDQAYCQRAAQAICSCYRRDEAQNPEGYAAALGAVLGDYSRAVVDYASDPRTGVSTEYPMGLPNVGQIRDFCDVLVRRLDVMLKPKPVARPFVPPPKLSGQIDSKEFFALVGAGKTPKAVVSRFEARSPEREAQSEADKAEMTALIQHANQAFWDRSAAGEA